MVDKTLEIQGAVTCKVIVFYSLLFSAFSASLRDFQLTSMGLLQFLVHLLLQTCFRNLVLPHFTADLLRAGSTCSVTVT